MIASYFPEQVAGQDGFGDRARQVQQALGHHPRPGRELNVVNSAGVVGDADVDVDIGQALGYYPKPGRYDADDVDAEV